VFTAQVEYSRQGPDTRFRPKLYSILAEPAVLEEGDEEHEIESDGNQVGVLTMQSV
jgi:hypothetical protein